MGYCGHWHGPWCWHEGYPYYDFPVPPHPGPQGRWREYARKDERADLEEYLDHLEAELQHARDRLEELQNAGAPKG